MHSRRGRRGVGAVALSLCGIIASSVLIAPAGAAQTLNVSGSWSPGGTGCPWILKAYGTNLESLHATWTGACDTKNVTGHAGLTGSFDGTLNSQGNAYSGNFAVHEGSVNVTGTGVFQIVSSSKVVATIHAVAGASNTSVITLTGHATGGLDSLNLNTDVRYAAAAMATFPEPNPGCAGKQIAQIYGTFQGHRTHHIAGGGGITTRVLNTRCHSPGITFFVNDISLATTGTTIVATFNVRIGGSAWVPNGQCVGGTTGTITATENDAARAPNGLTAATVTFGPWSGPCTPFDQTISNNVSSITADTKGSTWVRAFLGCMHPDTPEGYHPKNCFGG